MKLTIKSKLLDKEITFSRPNQYIFVDINGKEGTLGAQACNGGRLMGDTLSYYGDDKAEFSKICRKWYKSHIHILRALDYCAGY